MVLKMIDYEEIIVESYYEYGSGLHGCVHVRPAVGQQYPQDIRVECSKELRTKYKVGTKFRIKVKLTNKQGGKDFLYSSYKWPYSVIE